MAEQRYAYIYALIDHTTNECTDVYSTTAKENPDDYLPDILLELEEEDENLLGKYYINGAWYRDAAGTIPYNPN